MAKAMQKYFCKIFSGAETMNIQPSEPFPVYGNYTQYKHGLSVKTGIWYNRITTTFFSMRIDYFTAVDQLAR